MTSSLSRREFIRQAPAGAVAALIAAEPPPRAWIILQDNWEHNDDFSYVGFTQWRGFRLTELPQSG